MNRPLFIGSFGGPKVGKTKFAASVFDSVYIDPTRVFYADNHGSTDAMNLPQWSTTERWGVKHYASDNPEALYKDLFAIRKEVRAGRQKYDVIVIDDWSEFAQADIDERMDEDEGDRMAMKNWGAHGDLMRSTAKLVFPRVTGAHHIGIFQATQMPDPLEMREKEVNSSGKLVFSSDVRETMLRPFLQGAFASYLPYKLDFLGLQTAEMKGKNFKFQLQLVPSKEAAVMSRWLQPWVDDPKRPTHMENPTFDKLFDLFTSFGSP